MPLKVTEIADLRTFTREFVTNRGFDNMDEHNNDLQYGVNLGNSDGTSGGSEYTYGSYCHNSDLYLWEQIVEKKDPGLTRILYPAKHAHDGLCRDNNRGWWIPTTFQPNFASISGQSFHFGGTGKRRMIMGQPNLQTGAQVFYFYGDISGSPNSAPEVYTAGWHSFNCLDGSRASGINSNLFPNFSPDWNSSLVAADGNTAGYWTGGSGVNANQDEYHGILFEGITDTTGGMPGETNSSAGMKRALGAHPEGLLLVRARASNFLGDGPSNNLGLRWIWVDVDTGLAVGILGIPTIANNGSTNPFKENTLDFREFEWQGVQFVPDDGSTFAEPKGELHLFLAEDSRFEIVDQPVDPEEGDSFTSLVNRQYVAVHDFNPFNNTNGAVRIHNRRRFIGILDTPCEPIIDGGVDLGEYGTTHVRRSPSIYYHPPTRTYINVQSSFATANNSGADEPVTGASRIIRWQRQTQVDAITQPVPLDVVREDSLLTIRMKVTNDFGEPIAGETINFRTTRSSTRDEQFDGTVQASSNYVVAQGVIDDDYSLQVYEGAGIDDGGTLLEEGVDYTVSSYATGTLAPVGSWPTDTISVRYRHRSSVVTPGYGTLYNATAVSNSFGVVPVFIELGENLEGELVGVEADSEVFA